jgi:outer membrane protein OmpA-like peptidoglycan-associated protein
MKKTLAKLSFVLLSAAAVSGCASKGFVRGELDSLREEMNARDAELTVLVEEVSNSTSEAFARAEAAAGKAGEARDLALGRVGYEIAGEYAVHFALSSDELDPESRAILDEAAALIRAHNEYLVDIYGFTDRSGSSSSNLVLGQRRADAVLRYLVSQEYGTLGRFAAVSLGEDRPAGTAAESRRVEVKLIARTAPLEETTELHRTGQ